MLILPIISVIIVFIAYFSLASSTGELIPGVNDIPILREINASLLGKEDVQDSLLSSQNNDSVRIIGAQAGEARHIWPWDIFLSYDKFTRIHSIFTLDVNNLGALLLSLALFVSVIVGLLKFSEENREDFKYILIFFALFYVFNYLAFYRNTDQSRYHFFLSVLLFGFAIHGLQTIYRKVARDSTFAKLLLIAFGAVLLVDSLNVYSQQKWLTSQAYRPSIGGIESAKEVGAWLNSNSGSEAVIWKTCYGEEAYYSNRDFQGNWMQYFTDPTEWESYVRKEGIDYVVVAKSQIVDDSEWSNLCWVPRSFFERISILYKVKYVTSLNDYYVYRVE